LIKSQTLFSGSVRGPHSVTCSWKRDASCGTSHKSLQSRSICPSRRFHFHSRVNAAAAAAVASRHAETNSNVLQCKLAAMCSDSAASCFPPPAQYWQRLVLQNFTEELVNERDGLVMSFLWVKWTENRQNEVRCSTVSFLATDRICHRFQSSHLSSKACFTVFSRCIASQKQSATYLL